jgi:hypothetical protein
MDLQAFRNDKGTEDYYKSTVDLRREEGDIEWFFDNLEDAFSWCEMKKGEEKQVGSVYAYCADRIIIDTSETINDIDYNSFEGNILIMLSYDTYPDDTIKLRFEYNGETEEDEQEMFACADRSIYYLDSEEQEHPHDYSGFQDLCSAVENGASL